MTGQLGVVTGGTLIDGTGSAPVPLRWLAFDSEGLITDLATGDVNDRPLPAGAVVVADASGKTVMPGLIDAHCHISYGVARGIEEQDLFGSAEYRAIRGMYHARSVLQAGVTSISDPGGSYFVAVAIRDAIKGRLFPGPRMSAAARYLSTHTALTDYFPSWVGSPASAVGVLTENASQMLSEGPQPGEKRRRLHQDRGERRVIDPDAWRRQRAGVPSRRVEGHLR